MVFALLSLGAAFFHLKFGGRLGPIFAAVFIQLRLLMNLMDGMVAVEFGKKSKTGDLWNDVPDRIADVLIILGAGYMARAVELALVNCVLAVFTAYLRVLGASLKSPHYFLGPMAKPHRMALLTGAYLIEAIYPTGRVLFSALLILVIGQLVTCGRRLTKIARDLETK